MTISRRRVIDPDGTEADMAGPVYSFELTGEAILVTADIEGSRVCARGDRRSRHPIGAPIGMRLDRHNLFLFDEASEARIPRD